MRRIIEQIIAGIIIFVLSPLILFILVLVRIESNGNPIFVQKRVGKKGILFDIYKIRTMYIAQEVSHISDNVEARKYENYRVTKIGRFLRKYHIDETLQFLNILKGDMSFVGPRPISCRDLKNRTYYTPRDQDTLPGLTGLYQIMSHDEMSDDLRDEFDRFYFANKDWVFDCLLILWTPIAIILKIIPKYPVK